VDAAGRRGRVGCKSGAHCTDARVVRRNAASPFAPYAPDAAPRSDPRRPQRANAPLVQISHQEILFLDN
jgi:hypothetical protein